MTEKTQSIPASSGDISAKSWGSLAALGLGLVLLFGVGFAGPSVIHNAAHDARHAIAFPCH